MSILGPSGGDIGAILGASWSGLGSLLERLGETSSYARFSGNIRYHVISVGHSASPVQGAPELRFSIFQLLRPLKAEEYAYF